MATIALAGRRRFAQIGVAAATTALVLSLHSAPGTPVRSGDAGTVDADGNAPRSSRWENRAAVEATFLAQSYRPGAVASLVLWRPERTLRIQFFQAGPERVPTPDPTTMEGVP